MTTDEDERTRLIHNERIQLIAGDRMSLSHGLFLVGGLGVCIQVFLFSEGVQPLAILLVLASFVASRWYFGLALKAIEELK